MSIFLNSLSKLNQTKPFKISCLNKIESKVPDKLARAAQLLYRLVLVTVRNPLAKLGFCCSYSDFYCSINSFSVSDGDFAFLINIYHFWFGSNPPIFVAELTKEDASDWVTGFSNRRGFGGLSDWHFCSSWAPCQLGQGDCDSDIQCADNLVCGRDNCKFFNETAEVGADCCTSFLTNSRCGPDFRLANGASAQVCLKEFHIKSNEIFSRTATLLDQPVCLFVSAMYKLTN